MTKFRFLGILGSLVITLGLVVPAKAAEAKPKAYVVLVGISKYEDKQILPRPHAEADAQALYDVFQNPKYLGVDKDHIKLLLGTADAKRSAQKATHANVQKALNWLASSAGPEDLAILAFIGQGAPMGEKTCYFTSDSTFKGRSKDALAASEVEAALNKMKSQKFCAFIDVNFKGFVTGKEPVAELNLLSLYRELIGKEDDAGQYASRVVFLANSGLKPSLDLKDHGIFTQALLEGLGGKADTFGYQPDGRVTVEELAKYMRRAVLALAEKSGKTDADKKQKSIVLEGQSSDFTITRNPAVTATVRKHLEKINEMARAGIITKKVADQGVQLLDRMPKLTAQQELRKVYQQLVEGKLQAKEFLASREKILSDTRISREDARDYAVTILKATRIIKAGYVKALNQGQMVEWAIRGLFRRLEERVPTEYQAKVAAAKKMKERDLRMLLTDIREHLGKREDLEKGKDVTLTLTPMLTHLDKHTDYISPEILDQLKVETTGEFYGIGAHIRMNSSREMLQIVSTILGSPAYKAKLYAGDLITKITRLVDDEGKPLPKPISVATKGMPTDKAVKLIKGPERTKVRLTVERDGKEMDFEITRGRVEVETVMGYKRQADDNWSFYVDPVNKIGYIRISQFSRNTYRDLYQAMKKVSKQGINGLVLDMRFNPGGLLDSAVKVSDLFIDDGVIVTIRPRRGQETVYIGKHAGSYLNFPMAVLVNDLSASGSEIVAACLQDHHRAIVVGQRSYGKGSVQTILPFAPTGGQIKLTNASFWRPNGKNLNKSSTEGKDSDEWGVTPDQGYLLNTPLKEQDSLFEFQREQEIIKRPDLRDKNKKPDFKDRQLDLALNYLKEQMKMAAKNRPGKKAG